MAAKKIGNSIFSWEQEAGIDSPLGNWRKQEEQKLSIKYVSCSFDDTNYKIKFLITNTGLANKEAELFFYEHNEVFSNTSLAVEKIKLSSTSKAEYEVEVKKSKIDELDTDFEYGGFEFEATISCNGVSAKSSQFSMSCVKAVKKEEEKKPEVKKEEEKCLCKKTVLTAEDVKTIVTKLRKKEILGKRRTKDENDNWAWLNKDGEVIPSTDRGKRPKDAVKLNTEDYSFYDDITSDGKKIKDRLFYLEIDEKIDEKSATYANFSKELNSVFKKYKINTCLRKIHFLAQIYHESQRFSSTYENISNTGYSGGDDYQGRGFIQVTHDYNYTSFYKHLFPKKKEPSKKDIKDFAPKIASNLEYALKSAGWYWEKENINKYADIDDIEKVSAAINKPSLLRKKKFSPDGVRHLPDRKKYYNYLKEIFDYENCK